MMGTFLWIHAALALGVGYFLGSIPSATWIAKLFYGVDITKVGSGNPGMTNVLRTLGWKPTVPVIIIDAGKGVAAAAAGTALTGSQTWGLLAGLLAVLGHSFTCFANFKGGKSVLTGFGVFLYFLPISALTTLGIWLAVVLATKYVSLGSITSAIVLPLSVFLESHFRPQDGNLRMLVVAILVGGFVLYRHRGNMQRLWAGTEHKFGKSKA